jgi:hypothetical protein
VQRLSGFRPVGEHVRLVREMLDDITEPCATCEGTGLHDVNRSDACPVCHGFGVVYSVSLEELEKRRQAVLSVYPDCGVEDWQPMTQFAITGRRMKR